MIIVLEGSLGAGFTAYGPFGTQSEAIEWADANCSDHWEVVQVFPSDVEDR